MAKKVLVIGAGPVGLVTALSLAKPGIDVTVIEAEDGIVESPRAMGYHWPVLDGLEMLGLLDDMKEEGFIQRQFSFRILKTDEQILFDASVLKDLTDHPYMLVLGQNKLAKIVLRHVERHSNITIAWKTHFQSLEQDSEGVTIKTLRDGEEQIYEADWLIATDGARSQVRKAVGLDFGGITWPKRFIATNIHFDFDKYGWGRMGYLLDPQFGAVMGKLDRDGLWRVMFSESAELPVEGMEARIGDYMQAVLPGDKKYELAMFNGYGMHQRSAEAYRVGRVLLAGDAAHATNPTSGYGLVGGLFDSYALTDALTAVLAGTADESVLDDYATARRKVFEEITSPVSTTSMRLVFDSQNNDQLARTADALRARSQDPVALLNWYKTQASLETPSLVTGETTMQRRAKLKKNRRRNR
jgi:3-(3-hydroxy-phenyl)propionate hydroxylase